MLKLHRWPSDDWQGIGADYFKNMPELSWTFGYPLSLLAIIASGVLPLIWFKRRGWFD